MKVLKLALPLLLLALLSPAAQPQGGGVRQTTAGSSKWAVLVGVGQYQDSSINPLPYAPGDARAFRDLLVERGDFPDDHIALLVDGAEEEFLPSKANILRKLALWLKLKARLGDTVVFYFSGHGIGDQETGYLVPADAHLYALTDESVSLERVRDYLKMSKADVVFLVLDACHSGLAEGGMSEAFGKGVIPVEVEESAPGKGWIALTSCAPGEFSYPLETKKPFSADNRSAFTHYFLEGLEGPADTSPQDGVITVRELNEYVHQRVTEWALLAGVSQEPQIKISGSGAVTELRLLSAAPSVSIDRAPPALVFLEPKGVTGSAVIDVGNEVSSVRVMGLAVDDRGVVEVSINGRAATLSRAESAEVALSGLRGSGVKFKGRVLLALGDNSVEVAGADTSGNRARLSFTVRRREAVVGVAVATLRELGGPSLALPTVVGRSESVRKVLEAGRTLYLAGDYGAAEERFRAALQAEPTNYLALCLLGAACLQQQKMREAKEALDRSLEVRNDYAPALINLATWYLSRDDPANAVKLLESVGNELERSSEGWFNLGAAYLALGDPRKALESLSRAGEFGMGGGELSYARSLAKNALGDFAGALAEARAACEEVPGEAKLWAHLARLELDGGNVHAGWGAAIRALRARPLHPGAGAQLARLVDDHGAELTAEQSEELGRMAETNPGSFYLQYADGQLRLARGDLEPAASSFQRAVLAASGRDQAAAWGRLGLVYLLQENWEAAVRPLEESVKLDASVAGVHSNLALALFHLGEWERYEGEVKEVLQLDPGNEQALVSLGNLYAYRSEWDKAEEQYRLAAKQKGDDPELLGKIGRCQLGRKDWQGAIGTLDRAVSLQTDVAELFYLLGVGYEGSGERDKALGAYRKVLELEPNHKEATDRVEVLEG